LPPCLVHEQLIISYSTDLENAFYTTFGVVNQSSNSFWGARPSAANCLCPLFNAEYPPASHKRPS
jgi:hypothetical protein